MQQGKAKTPRSEHARAEQRVELWIVTGRRVVLGGHEAHGRWIRQNEPGGLWAGQGKASLLEVSIVPIKAWVEAAGLAQGILAQGDMDIAEIFMVEKGTAASLVDENTVAVRVQGHGLPETVPHRAVCFLVAVLGFWIDYDLPACAAGIRAVPGQAAESVKDFGCLKNHGHLLFVCPYYSRTRSCLKIKTRLNCLDFQMIRSIIIRVLII